MYFGLWSRVYADKASNVLEEIPTPRRRIVQKPASAAGKKALPPRARGFSSVFSVIGVVSRGVCVPKVR